MKRFILLMLTVMLLLSCTAHAEEIADPLGCLFECGSTVFSMDLAKAAMLFSSHYSADDSRKAFSQAAFDVILQMRYDKPESDTSHTSSFSLGSRTGLVGGEVRTLAIVTIRGTFGGEWMSNFDFAPSHSDDTMYAENFLMAAMDVYASVKPELDKMTSPVILVTGHSRGAAVANLLATLLNGEYGIENVFCYTFATPNTVRGDFGGEYGNIFNLINPADAVTYLPMLSMGYCRAGTDIILPGDAERTETVKAGIAVLGSIVDGISDYYESKKPFASGIAITPFEFASSMLYSLATQQQAAQPQSEYDFDPESPYMPAVALLGGISQDNTRAAQLGTQHMPDMYLKLMNEYAG